ncbi:DNA repair protein Rad50 [Clostridium perfringens]|uniref:DNA repair protein Rad50 n=1 Tax=Clostridium perfringens TaxID=1502 RepID=UPI0018E454C2|nr:DNA repair protein Rad50 [Clostridium perfringens]MBI6004735.1 DNA repair protein Rad50 [Clostridium perfringens]MBI6017586.1 DNA repair protein Rad50 [Clostridium perfringens]MDK0528406.1 DNA repair protein Rad50 [Clostridium perfringens]MDK0555750.1 DNA repair protein Rad50 [Clostridium perfringens]MDK0587698.1 DNA repair protein Rad50 [Clostridium perfringens]
MAFIKKSKETEVKEVDIMKIKRYMDIKNYLVSIWGIVNINAEHQALSNPIAVKVAYSTLLELESELIGIELTYGDIDINNVFNNRYSNFTEEFILKTSNNTAYMYKDYEKLKSLEELEVVYPIEKRKARLLELESDIAKLVEITVKLEKINKPLASKNYKEIETKRAELNSLLETIEGLKTEKELKFKIFSYADMDLKETKNKVEEYRIYLEKLLRKMGEE